YFTEKVHPCLKIGSALDKRQHSDLIHHSDINQRSLPPAALLLHGILLPIGTMSDNQNANIRPPQFIAANVPGLSASASAAVQSRGTPSTLNLDDIFAAGAGYAPVPQAGGIVTTGLHKPKASATVMGNVSGNAAPPAAPFAQAPQRPHHLQYAYVQAGGAPPAPASGITGGSAGGAKRGRGAPSSGGVKPEGQSKADRRERNREHAKRSRIRKKFLLESLQQSVSLLKEENEKLKSAIRSHLGDKEADALLSKQALADAAGTGGGLIASSSADANKVLDDPDFSFIKALQTAQQNFVVTDPSLPDNPIVYATQGFLNLTGYTLDQVLGRNCRFLQGPETDPKAVEKIRNAIEEGSDMSVCLLNYRVDGTTFWNQFFIAALRDAGGNITNYVGVQCKVSDQYAASVCKKQEEADAAAVADDGAGFKEES
ncbi:hypothetical protein ACHAXR_011201, partial [Thalassiosira sp. AJA248-18]